MHKIQDALKRGDIELAVQLSEEALKCGLVNRCALQILLREVDENLLSENLRTELSDNQNE